MKNFLLLIIIPFLSFGQQQIYVPDDNFEQYLISEGYDNVLDDYVLLENIDSVEYLLINNLDISDLTGLESFTSLKNLNCIGNNLTEIDVSQNISLVHLDCSSNQLNSIDVSNNIELISLRVWGNSLTELDVFNLESLEFINCNVNQLETLNTSQNYNLLELSCHSNNLNSLNVTNNNLLTNLYCHNNNLFELDLSYNTNLFSFTGHNNNISCIQVWDIDDAVNAENNCEFGQLSDDNCFQKDDYTIWSLDCQENSDILELEIIENSKADGKLYNVLGQEIFIREGIYIDGGEIKYRFK